MSNFDNYTHLALLFNEIGVRVRDPITREGSYFKIKYKPRTYSVSHSGTSSGWSTLSGAPLHEKRHDSIQDYRAYTSKAKYDGRDLYGTISPVQQFVAETISESCGLQFDKLRTAFIDIEVESANGFATPENPTNEITAITVEIWGKYLVWGCGNYTPTNSNILYTKCEDEAELLISFLKWWSSDYPDIVTGWNVQFYDIPYIVNRITLLKKKHVLSVDPNVLSPWRKISRRNMILMGKTQVVLDIVGVSILDYLELYRKFSLTQQESYRLDFIAETELGKKKVSYDEYGSLAKLAEDNYQLFVDYNINDVVLVKELNDKLHHLDLCVQIAYGARVNFTDTFKQVRLWDAMMYYDLYNKRIAVPPNDHHTKDHDYVGAYVKEPQLGKFSWVVSFDVNSLYPSIMRQWNISQDRHLTDDWLRNRLSQIEQIPGAMVDIVEPYSPIARNWIDDCSPTDAPYVRNALSKLVEYIENTDIEQMLSDLINSDDPWPWLRVLSVCITPNRQTFRSDSSGFMPTILERLYDERKKAKAKETTAKKLSEKAKNPIEKAKYEQEALQWGLQQTTRKLNLNSAYGAVGNQYHRFYDVRHAEAVTITGQLIIRYVAVQLNNFLNSQFGTKKDYVLASDTDSVYLTLEPVVTDSSQLSATLVDVIDQYCNSQIQPIIDDSFENIHIKFNTLTQVLAMKREVIAEHGVWTAKKRYLLWVHDNEGVRYIPPKLKSVGIEAVRSSTPKYARDVIKGALEAFIRDDKNEFYNLLDTAEVEFGIRPFEDIASPRTCNGLDVYGIDANGVYTTKTPMHVRGALVYNQHLEATGLTKKYAIIRNGEKIKFCCLKPQNPLRTTVIAAPNKLPSEWKLEKFLDRMEQFQKTVLGPLEAIVQYAQWTVRPTVTLDF
jgi:DNA polymerase elongation subunit (family B)